MSYRVWILSTNRLMDFNPGTFGAPSRYSLCSTMLSLIRFRSSKYSIAETRDTSPNSEQTKRLRSDRRINWSASLLMFLYAHDNFWESNANCWFKRVSQIWTPFVALLQSMVTSTYKEDWSQCFRPILSLTRSYRNQARTTKIIGENGRPAIIGHDLSGNEVAGTRGGVSFEKC